MALKRAVHCPDCGYQNNPADQFCHGCGEVLRGPKQPLPEPDPLPLSLGKGSLPAGAERSVSRNPDSVPQDRVSIGHVRYIEGEEKKRQPDWNRYRVLLLLATSAAAVIWLFHRNQYRLLNFDTQVAVFLNHFAGRWWTLDRVVKFLQSNELPQGLFAIAVFYYLWFQPGAETLQTRGRLLFSLLMCIPAVLAARAISAGLPFRVRPIYTPVLHLHRAYTFDPVTVISWSCFPSDHAVFYCTFATGIFLISRKAGLLLYLHAALVILLPRLFLGVHYASDIAAGALLGCGFGYLTQWQEIYMPAMRYALRLQEKSLGLFHAGLFYLAYESAHMYDDLRHLVVGACQVARALLRV